LPLPLQGENPSQAFFTRRGYLAPVQQPYEYDTARDLKNYQRLYPNQPAHTSILPLQPGQENALLDFLAREYPGRWQLEAEEFLRSPRRRLQDYLLLWVKGQVEGFCRLTGEESERPLERFYPQRLPRPWAQIGPLGLSKAARGQGLGGLLIDSAAALLAAGGVRGCVIDWTSLTALYAKFGFQPYNRYLTLTKEI